MVTMTCFMITRNVLRQGYPFVETIAQALPVCDEFLISDGYSDDGTWDILVKISNLNPKIKLYRDKWPGKDFAYDLRYATNVLRRKCKGDYIFYIQASEVIHEDSWDYLRELPAIWPKAITFSLPYVLFYGTLKFHEQYRLRMAKNLDYIEAIYDAWALGLKKSFIIKEFIKSFLNPLYFARIVYKGVHAIYAYTGGIPKYTVLAIPPKPIYRYQAIFPGDLIKRAREREEKWGTPQKIELTKEELIDLEKEENPMYKAYTKARETLERRGHQMPSYRILETPINEHPRIMRDLLNDKKSRHYYVREELFELIKGV